MNALPSALSETEARDGLLKKIIAQGDLPALGMAVSRVVQHASSGNDAVEELARLVLSDLALTQKILRVSNTVFYRVAAGVPVTTVSRAIFLLGFDTVKTIALATLLVEGLSGRRRALLRDELHVALCASMIGRELGRRSRFRDPEEAAVAALFRNLGRVMAVMHDVAAFQRVERMVGQGMAEKAAALRVLGCTFEHLGAGVLEGWRIPSAIVHATQSLPDGALGRPRTRDEWLQQVASLSAELARLLCARRLEGSAKEGSAKERDVREEGAGDGRSPGRAKPQTSPLDELVLAPLQPEELDALLARYGSALQLNRADLEAMLSTVTEEAEVLMQHGGQQLEDEPEGFCAMPADVLMTPPPALGLLDCHPSGKPITATRMLMQGVQELTALNALVGVDRRELVLSTLEILQRGLGFSRVALCLLDVAAREYRARLLLGDDAERLEPRMRFAAGDGPDLFRLALKNAADVVIADTATLRLREMLPTWHREAFTQTRSFILLPLSWRGKVIGFLYGDRDRPAPEGITPEESQLIRMIKGQVVAGLGKQT